MMPMPGHVLTIGLMLRSIAAQGGHMSHRKRLCALRCVSKHGAAPILRDAPARERIARRYLATRAPQDEGGTTKELLPWP
jgi:hypothetical protein